MANYFQLRFPCIGAAIRQSFPVQPMMENGMKMIQKAVVVAVMALASSVAFAQSKSEVTVKGGVSQAQFGDQNKQSMDLGNAKDGGQSKVTITGAASQIQGGDKNKQTMRVGNAANGGTSTVSVTGAVSQMQFGDSNTQDLNVGNAE
jgi:phage-related protein